MLNRDIDAQVSRFWDKYIEKTIACGVPEKLVKWYVRHAEQYIKAHSLRLRQHLPETVDKYFQAKGRNIYIKTYQFNQLVDAIKILFVDIVHFSRSPLKRSLNRSYGYASAGDRKNCLAEMSLEFCILMKHPG